ncbi:MAG: hypothetical protein CO186_10630 [Zetaproteobacteria bacterium CG_4_9_14_3_um_filter_49_83]|nr:MAG: hypothetical protein AUJ56_09450 [Zetaproteobacteria bacterium CG1_02_49_23]PIQ30680.1 MAG: hypothetical protein COW62_11585 [Zetaproteobacteria bacterium CG17_big_fil_post_rev_8_21_14_2_50_50_13]PIV29629.1 MAG: hypothetical protein COS35_11020 [Zetaproteobacteria bacterium CG02_land_8_20_14_3_00_50_9]PIY57170.1 MAG: hypothetical protein COZ00_00265 [Zetaproteobacteria bacterium CG_4_10_14_0_8_um_filter_49_80]PJA34445.1 MAG: hypothetical protein CO186_10630 [Zetaproteobacteria bacterium
MFIVGYFLQACAVVLHMALMAVLILVIARAVLSWVSPDPYNPIVRTIYQLSEPMLYAVRRRLPAFQGIDLSPMVILLLVYFLDVFLVQTIERVAFTLTH